jgi:hypothetical protein
MSQTDPTPIRLDWKPVEIWAPIASVFLFNGVFYFVA